MSKHKYTVSQALFSLINLTILTIATLLPAQIRAMEPGFTPGEFAVDESGAAQYTLPITVPPSVAGMKPALVLNYSSRSGNGLLGQGWTLGGLSVVTRCAATQAQDGFISGIHFDAKDRYCIDGQRLIAISGPDGGDGTEYRTELDAFTKVISRGQQGSGPAWFEIWTKSGQIMRYGFTPDARIEAQGRSDVRLWAVDKIEDSATNRCDFGYIEDATEGSYRPDLIQCGANANLGTSHASEVRFFYEGRPDIVPLYLGGSLIKNTVRLSEIKTYHTDQTNTLVKQYKLSYAESNPVPHSRLIRVQECDAQGLCLAPTKFSWQENQGVSFTQTARDKAFWTGDKAHHFVTDLIGNDGVADVLQIRNSKLNGGKHAKILQGQSDGSFIDLGLIGGLSSWVSAASYVGDFTCDGVQDVLTIAHASSKPTRVALNAGDGEGTFTTIWYELEQGAKFASGQKYVTLTFDMNADGCTDVMQIRRTGSSSIINQVFLSTGDGFTRVWTSNAFKTQDVAQVFPGDFDGDGIADLLVLGRTGQVSPLAQIYWGNGDGSFTAGPSNELLSVGDNAQTLILDINSDRLSDILQISHTGSLTRVFLNSGDGSFMPVSPSSLWNGNDAQTLVGDFNGDQLPDIFQLSKNKYRTPRAQLLLGLGDGTFQPERSINQDLFFQADRAQTFLADINGADGIVDLLQIVIPTQGAVNEKLIQTVTSAPEVITNIVNGLGHTTEISYSPATDPAVYSKGQGAEYPVFDIQAPMLVVDTVQLDNGIGAQQETRYHYSGARLEVMGRGFLGFAVMQATDQSTGIVTQTQYRQDFPYTGLTSRTEQRLANGILIGESDNSYAVIETHPGVYFPYLATSTSKDYELDGSWVSTSTVDNDFDNYGNAIQTLATKQGSAVNGGTETFTTATFNTYNNDTNQWHLGRLQRAEVMESLPDGTSATRISAFEYDQATGILIKEIIEPDTPALRHEKRYTLNASGQIVATTVQGGSGPTAFGSRTATTDLDAREQFPIESCNVLGHCETYVHDARFGVMTQQTGPNGLTTTRSADGFGRVLSETGPDGNQTRMQRYWCAGVSDSTNTVTCPTHAVLFG